MARPIHGRTVESVVPRDGELHYLPAAALAVEVERVVVFIEQPRADLAYSRVELTHQLAVFSQLITLPQRDASPRRFITRPSESQIRRNRGRGVGQFSE